MAEEDDGGFKSLIDEYKKAAEKRQRELNRVLGNNDERKTIAEQAPKRRNRNKEE